MGAPLKVTPRPAVTPGVTAPATIRAATPVVAARPAATVAAVKRPIAAVGGGPQVVPAQKRPTLSVASPNPAVIRPMAVRPQAAVATPRPAAPAVVPAAR